MMIPPNKTLSCRTSLLAIFCCLIAPALAQSPVPAPPEEPNGLIEIFQQGGVILIIQILLSIFGATFIIERIVNLKRQSIIPNGLITEARALWNTGNIAQLKALKRNHPSVAAEIISYLAAHRTYSPADLSTSAGDIAAREIEIHSQKIYPIAVVATLEPLIGLLGTVVGMMSAFKTVATAGALGDASLLAGDISMALITTAAGLTIAVPFLGVYHFYKSRIALYTAELEREITDLISDWFMVDHTHNQEH